MTPAQVAAKLQHFNEWRRGHHDDAAQPDPREIGEAIDAAVEMIERLEAAEKSDAESLAMYRKARDERDALRAAVRHEADCVEACKSEIDRLRAENAGLVDDMSLLRDNNAVLRARVEAMERQEPVGKFTQHPSNGLWEQDGYGDNPEASPLYALPGAKGEEK